MVAHASSHLRGHVCRARRGRTSSAIRRRDLSPPSWRGVGAVVAAHGLRQSASVRGPGDNAHAESFWHSHQADLTRGVVFLTDDTLRVALRHCIRYCNRTR
jgi:hypothetical protein